MADGKEGRCSYSYSNQRYYCAKRGFVCVDDLDCEDRRTEEQREEDAQEAKERAARKQKRVAIGATFGTLTGVFMAIASTVCYRRAKRRQEDGAGQSESATTGRLTEENASLRTLEEGFEMKMKQREILTEVERVENHLASLEQVTVEEIQTRPNDDRRLPDLVLQFESLKVARRTPTVVDAAMEEALMREIQSRPYGDERRLDMILQLGTRHAAKRLPQLMAEPRLGGDEDDLPAYTATPATQTPQS